MKSSKFILLTVVEFGPNSLIGEMYVRKSSINIVCPHEEGSKLILSDGKTLVVKEEPSEILELINGHKFNPFELLGAIQTEREKLAPKEAE